MIALGVKHGAAALACGSARPLGAFVRQEAVS
jgi:hypothetical protein